MKIGILADIHEDVDHLRWAIGGLRGLGADVLLVLGDICGMNTRLAETVALLDEAATVGVWGNHDFGLCAGNHEPNDLDRFGARTLAYMDRLRPRLELDGCLFTHVEPWLDPGKVEDLWYFDGPPDTPEKAARSFAAVPNRVMFVGHYHRWMVVREGGLVLTWAGEAPVVLDPAHRHLVAVDAVCAGRCALFDTATNELVPLDAGWGRTCADTDPAAGAGPA